MAEKMHECDASANGAGFDEVSAFPFGPYLIYKRDIYFRS